ncbi:MAG TPA: cysteine--tRNA ligase [Ktedonobacterales bacterium]|nr:cysteine--tRNA ligase [Ktedonobacterales bacterium]
MLIHNTESGREEVFEPYGLPVKMYVCGLTPKNEPHLGHARLFIVNDMVRRYLAYRGYPVRYIQNFTDIDDKTIAAGLREGISPFDAAQRYMDAYFDDMDALNVERADEFTYVTKYIPQIIEMVQGLIDRGHAYEIDGDVYFSVPSFPSYGRLSGRNAEAMLAGARIEPDERKHDPRDFALWKAAKPGEPWWESPWGRGRPGWHIECSTMAREALGDQIDIHGGGTDLIFPHHENEIAQSESFTGVEPFVRYWVHTGMLTMLGEEGKEEKIAHSGRFVTIRSTLAGGEIPPPALRTYLLGTHYHANLMFSEEQLRGTIGRWRRWVEARNTALRLKAWAAEHQPAGVAHVPGTAESGLLGAVQDAHDEFVAAMDDDFNTSLALSVIDELAHRTNDYAHSLGGEEAPAGAVEALGAAAAMLEELTGVLGISLEDVVPENAHDEDARVQIEALVAERTVARARKDWGEADRIRRALEDDWNVVVKDTPQGPTWSVRES